MCASLRSRCSSPCWRRCHTSRRRSATRAARLAHRSRVLAALHDDVGGGRNVSLRELRLEREDVSVRHSHASANAHAERRVSRRRARAEFHVHRESPAASGGDLRHPPTERDAAPHVQGAVRAFAVARVRSCRACSHGRWRARSRQRRDAGGDLRRGRRRRRSAIPRSTPTGRRSSNGSR